MSFKLTAEQQARAEEIKRDNTKQDVHTAKWELIFNDGKGANYLTEYCLDKHSAFISAIERFGRKVKDIKQ